MTEKINKLSQLRQDYTKGSLGIKSVLPDPFEQFSKWYEEASDSSIKEPNAVVLTTCTTDGIPSSRVILMKDFGPEGLTFYTNYLSRKGREMEQNPNVSLLFFWDVLERQVRLEGRAERLTSEESDKYFKIRPRKSKLGALASEQSQTLSGREKLEERFEALSGQYPEENSEIPRPEYWGGYRVKLHYFEFWQGRESRLHDRICFNQRPDGIWSISRLSP